jgi:hypothetical protein
LTGYKEGKRKYQEIKGEVRKLRRSEKGCGKKMNDR